MQGALAASGPPFARHEQSTGLFVSGLTPEGDAGCGPAKSDPCRVALIVRAMQPPPNIRVK
ncbi:MAG: hypothetical protein KDG57_10115, partial [Rhodoferax sp.]|nr:hypothetical protein [Rhodoferax sp.]